MDIARGGKFTKLTHAGKHELDVREMAAQGGPLTRRPAASVIMMNEELPGITVPP